MDDHPGEAMFLPDPTNEGDYDESLLKLGASKTG